MGVELFVGFHVSVFCSSSCIFQLDYALSPTLKDIKVDWGSIQLTDPCTPLRPPPLFSGSRFLAYAFSPVAAGSISCNESSTSGNF